MKVIAAREFHSQPPAHCEVVVSSWRIRPSVLPWALIACLTILLCMIVSVSGRGWVLNGSQFTEHVSTVTGITNQLGEGWGENAASWTHNATANQFSVSAVSLESYKRIECTNRSYLATSSIVFNYTSPYAATLEGVADYTWDGPTNNQKLSLWLSFSARGATQADGTAIDFPGGSNGRVTAYATACGDEYMMDYGALEVPEVYGTVNLGGYCTPTSAFDDWSGWTLGGSVTPHTNAWTGWDTTYGCNAGTFGGAGDCEFNVSLNEGYDVTAAPGTIPEVLIYVYFGVDSACSAEHTAAGAVPNLYAYGHSWFDPLYTSATVYFYDQ
jgi:hypothetical protein